MKRIYKDYCGTYAIEIHRDGTATAWHNVCGKRHKIGNYKTEKGAKIALARYCDGMPKEVEQ